MPQRSVSLRIFHSRLQARFQIGWPAALVGVSDAKYLIIVYVFRV